jgi:hypothetical protein
MSSQLYIPTNNCNWKIEYFHMTQLKRQMVMAIHCIKKVVELIETETKFLKNWILGFIYVWNP